MPRLTPPLRARLRAHLAALLRDERGAVVIIAALALIVMLGFAALAVDGGRLYHAHTQLQGVADSAALSGAAYLPHAGDVRAAATRYARKNAPGGDGAPELVRNEDVEVGNWNHANRTFTAGGTPTNAVRVVSRQTEATGNAMPTSLARVLGVAQVDVTAEAIAMRGASGIELALALDVTGSMKGSKLTALKDAANGMLDELYGDADTAPDVYVGVVPFAERVNIGTGRTSWVQSTPLLILWSGCVESRSGTPGLDDTPPGAGKFQAILKLLNPAAANCPPEVLPLSASKATVRAAINALSANGYTRTDMGLKWGWRVVSERWRGLWGNPDLPRPADEPSRKIVIIMTDGENNPPNYDSLTKAQADQRLVQTCALMKEAGITVYSITFDAPTWIDEMYTECASAPENFFRSPTVGELSDAFSTIAGRLAGVRLVR